MKPLLILIAMGCTGLTSCASKTPDPFDAALNATIARMMSDMGKEGDQ